MKRFIVLIVILFVMFGGIFYSRRQNNSPSVIPSEKQDSEQSSEITSNKDQPAISVVAQNLDTPWSMGFLPDGSMLVTERKGSVRLIDSSGTLLKEPVAIINNVKEIGEGGLLGLAVHPKFSQNSYVYLYYTYGTSGNNTMNRVVRMVYSEKNLSDETIMVDRIPGASNHNGGRIKFGPDGFLYIGTGDAQEPTQAQNTKTLGGKILRVTDEGKPAPGNPFGNEVYSYGHRNVQGLAWDDTGNLWSTEHGRSGVASGYDELNLIEIGKNYGWPDIEGDETASGITTPKRHSGATNTWAPSGATYANGSIYFTGLRGQALYQAGIANQSVIDFKELFKGEYGRIRDVITGPDGMLYMSLSNRDGRGNPAGEDDRIFRINLSKL